jgi:predicted  nucleic acid-binding Zn-ribbon protein
MATNDDMREQLKGLETKFGGLETKFTGLEQKFTGLEQKFGGLEQKFGGLEEKIDQLPTAADFTRLADKVTILLEDAKTAVTNAADGYKGTLERIERDLGELNKKVDVKFSDHDKILANHNERIAILEAHRHPSSGGV